MEIGIIAGGQAEALGGLADRLRAPAAKQDRRTPAGADDHVRCVLVHDRPVRRRNGDGPAARAQADDVRQVRHAMGRGLADHFVDRKRLPLFLGELRRIRARCVHKDDHGTAALLGQVHQVDGLAIAVGEAHPLVPPPVLLQRQPKHLLAPGGGAGLLPDENHVHKTIPNLDPALAADDELVSSHPRIREKPHVTKDVPDVVERLGTQGMPGKIGVFYRGNPVFTTSVPTFVDMDRRVIAKFAKDDILLSGYAENIKLVANNTAAVEKLAGKISITVIITGKIMVTKPFLKSVICF